MEPDICLIMRRAKQIQADCYEADGWDFAETYSAIMRHANLHFHGRLPGSKTAWINYLDELDSGELELPSGDE